MGHFLVWYLSTIITVPSSLPFPCLTTLLPFAVVVDPDLIVGVHIQLRALLEVVQDPLRVATVTNVHDHHTPMMRVLRLRKANRKDFS